MKYQNYFPGMSDGYEEGYETGYKDGLESIQKDFDELMAMADELASLAEDSKCESYRTRFRTKREFCGGLCERCAYCEYRQWKSKRAGGKQWKS